MCFNKSLAHLTRSQHSFPSRSTLHITIYTSIYTSCINSDVCTKYQEAAKIVNLALEGLVQQCLPGAKVLDLCEFGHTVISTAAQKLYTKKVHGQTVERGVAFPVCISVNNCVCNYSPLIGEERVRVFLFWHHMMYVHSSCAFLLFAIV
jgi:hypothetical protein